MNGNSTEFSGINAIEELFRTPSNIAYMAVCSVIITLNIYLNATYIYLYNKARIRMTNFNLCLAHYSAGCVFANFGFLPFLFIDVTKISTTDQMTQRLLCGIVLEGHYFFFWGGSVCAFMLTFMSVKRCLTIKYPFMETLHKKKIHHSAALFWLIGFIIMTPNVMLWKMYREHGLCVRTKEFGNVFNIVYVLTVTSSFLIGPPIIMLICLIIIILHFFKKLDKATNKTILRYRKSIVKSLTGLIMIFLTCGFGFFLYNVLNFFGYFGEGRKGGYKKYRFVQYALIPVLLEGVLNVLVYNLGNKNIRIAYIKLFKDTRRIFLPYNSNVVSDANTNIALNSSDI